MVLQYFQSGDTDWPYAAWRDVVFGVGVILAIVILAIIVGPPELGKPSDLSIIEAYPRPDWYFLWIFALFALISAGLESYLIIFGPVLVGIILILLPFIANRGEHSPIRRPWAIGIVLIIVLIAMDRG